LETLPRKEEFAMKKIVVRKTESVKATSVLFYTLLCHGG
jgi:hypothetical protein